MPGDEALDSLCVHLEQDPGRPDSPPAEIYETDASRITGRVIRLHNAEQPAQGDAAGEGFPVLRLDRSQLRPRRSVVQGLGFDEGGTVAVAGAPNAGKTALAVNMGVTAAARIDHWLGRKIIGTPVVYFAAEAPASVKMRAKAAAVQIDAPTSLPFYVCDVAPAIGDEAMSVSDAKRIVSTIRAVEQLEGERVLLVFLDTLASCLGDGDENGDGMIRLVNAAKYVAIQTGACVVLVHHPSKGDGPGSGLRGHGSLAAACDSVVRIETDEMTKIRTATLTKARDHATGTQIRFELEPVTTPECDSFGDAVTTVIVRSTAHAPAVHRPKAPRQRELLAELERRQRTGEHHWDEATICKAGRDLGMPRNSPRDALKALITAGYIYGSPGSLTLKHPPEDGK